MPFVNKEPTPTFVLTMPLAVSQNDDKFLHKEFFSYWRIYNDLVTITTKCWHQLRKTRKYRAITKAISGTPKDSEKQKALYAERNKLIKEAGFSRGGLYKAVKPIGKHFGVHSAVAQAIAERVLKAWEDFFFKKGKVVHYRRFDSFHSFRGKSNVTGIRCIAKNNGYVVAYKGYNIPIVFRNPATNTGWYQQEAMKSRVKYCAIIRRWVRHRWKYYVQVILEGYPPIKVDRNGVMKHPVGDSRVGLDIGTQTLAISAKNYCDLKVLAPSALAQAKGLVNEITRIQRAMDRSRRAMNPQHFDKDGTVKKLDSTKHEHKQIRKWIYSNRYFRLRARYRDLNRRLSDIRKMEHNMLANDLLQYGNAFIVEDMNYKALQKKSKETKVSEKTGRCRSKKRFGKSISRCAPAMFLGILKNKVERIGGALTKVNAFETKASQFDHTDDSYTKKKLCQRFAHLSDGTVVQRDLYSAFLLAHVNDNMKDYNQDAIEADFKEFLSLHDKTAYRLKHSTDWLPASVGF